MADTFLSFGLDKLWKLLERESELFQGVQEQFNELKGELEMLRCFLKDADAKKRTNKMVGKIVREIKEIVYDAEDTIETFLIKEEAGNTGGICNLVGRCFWIIVERRGFALEMEAISKRISKVIGHMKILGVQQITVNEGNIQSLLARQREMRQTFSNENESVLVGLETNVRQLVGHLMKQESSSQVVSITGMGGIGKTTLARHVFNHTRIKSYFKNSVWVCVSQQFTRKYVWQTILQNLTQDNNRRVSEMTEAELQENLVRELEKQSSLIVLDDIWTETDWEIIEPMFPREKGCKVLLTTRNEGVAMRADRNCFICRPAFLTFKEGWTLFRKIAFPKDHTTESTVDKEMEEMGKQMVKRCGGLPLTIKLLGGLLAAQYTLREWKRVYGNIRYHIVGGTSFNEKNLKSVYHVLHLSLEELPGYLKHCLIYLAHLPEDFEINVEKLSYYWAAEGISRPNYYHGASVVEVAEGCIEELVKRNMVISRNYNGRSLTCRLHDMMREVCLPEEENFAQIVDASTVTSTETSQSPCKSRRLVIHSPRSTFHVDEYIQNPSLRSLLFLKDYRLDRWMVSDLFFTSLQLMRVLDLSFAEFEWKKLPSNIGKLIHLRYLSLFMANVAYLPSSMQNLRQLLYLNLCVGGKYPIYIPNFLKEMSKLIYLFLPDVMQDETKLELGNLINLEKLENFSTEHSSVTDLQGMRRLRTLSILLDGVECTIETLSLIVGELRHLEILTIGKERLVDVRYIPKELYVDKVGLGEISCSWQRMVCLSGRFPQLKELYLNNIYQWKEWILEQGSMPLLQTLSIGGCGQLKELPDGLRFITSLKNLSIYTLNREFREKLSVGGEDYYKVKHICKLTIPGSFEKYWWQ